MVNKKKLSTLIATESHDDEDETDNVIRKLMRRRSRTGDSENKLSPKVTVRRRTSGSRRSIYTKLGGNNDGDNDEDGIEKLQMLKWQSETGSPRRRYREDMDATLSPSSQVGRHHEDVPIVRVINVDIHRNGNSIGSDVSSFPQKSSCYSLVDIPGSLD